MTLRNMAKTSANQTMPRTRSSSLFRVPCGTMKDSSQRNKRSRTSADSKTMAIVPSRCFHMRKGEITMHIKAHRGSRAAAASMFPNARKTRPNQLIIQLPSRVNSRAVVRPGAGGVRFLSARGPAWPPSPIDQCHALEPPAPEAGPQSRRPESLRGRNNYFPVLPSPIRSSKIALSASRMRNCGNSRLTKSRRYSALPSRPSSM